jgi:hypothetical protein
LDRGRVYDLAEAASRDPAIRANRTTLHNLHVLMAKYTMERRDLESTMAHLEAALSADFALKTLSFAMSVLDSAGLHAVADSFLEDARLHRPQHPIRAFMWQRNVKLLEQSRERYREG